jgi:GDP-4-dehydro-6-deoxy-D-mannose reductase
VIAFITGMTGFAGSHLAEHLIQCGDRVAGCSEDGRWRTAAPDALTEVPLVAWDLSRDDGAAILPVLGRLAPDVVYHLAAVAVPGDCGGAEPNGGAWELNVAGTRRLLSLLGRLPAPPRLVLISSGHVYAPITGDEPRRSEDSPLGPVTAYGKTKLAAEQIVQEHCGATGLNAVIVRSFKHAGPRQNARLMLAEWAIQMSRPGNGPIRVVNLDSYLDMTDVRDVVRAYRLVAEHGRSGEIYNVGSGEARRSGDIYQQMYELAGCRRDTVETSPGLRREAIADIARLRAATGWRPEIPLEQTLRDSLDYWRRTLGSS